MRELVWIRLNWDPYLLHRTRYFEKNLRIPYVLMYFQEDSGSESRLATVCDRAMHV